MNEYLSILNDVLRIATFQPTRSCRTERREKDWTEEAPARFRYERRGREKFFG